MTQTGLQGKTSRELLKYDEELLIALGSNLTSSAGTPAETLNAALEELTHRGAVIRCVSDFYSTPAFPDGSGPDFVNAAAALHAPWDVGETLEILHEVETALGRERKARWGERTLDVDLIARGDIVLPDVETHKIWREKPLDRQMMDIPAELILPHPRLQERAFVLIPLSDIAPDWRHPLLGRTVAEMCAALPDALCQEVRRVE